MIVVADLLLPYPLSCGEARVVIGRCQTNLEILWSAIGEFLPEHLIGRRNRSNNIPFSAETGERDFDACPSRFPGLQKNKLVLVGYDYLLSLFVPIRVR